MTIENTLERIADALEKLANPPIHMDAALPMNILPITAPAEMEPPIVEEKPEKKKRKKKAKAMAAAAQTPDTIPDVTKDMVESALRANVAKHQDDVFARSIIDKYQSGAKLSTLSEENYEDVFKELTENNDE